jgi:hypothetical protein
MPMSGSDAIPELGIVLKESEVCSLRKVDFLLYTNRLVANHLRRISNEKEQNNCDRRFINSTIAYFHPDITGTNSKDITIDRGLGQRRRHSCCCLKTKINDSEGRFTLVPQEKARVTVFVNCAQIETPDGSNIMGNSCSTMATTSDPETEPLYGVLMSVWTLGITSTPEREAENLFQEFNEAITDANLAIVTAEVKNPASKLFAKTHPQRIKH